MLRRRAEGRSRQLLCRLVQPEWRYAFGRTAWARHDIALRPDGGHWVAFARRPGRFGVAVPVGAGQPIWFATKSDRHFFGHGVFSADGRLLYSTENDYDGARGMIGVRDVTGGYKQIGEFPAHGMEPHDIALLSDGRTMVIANGGILTHPGSEGELNLSDMQPSLIYVDVETGDLIEEHCLALELHQLSIRHLAIGAGDVVAFGCQYRGPEEDAPPLIGFHRRGEQPVIVPAPSGTQKGLRNYIGSVAADSSGGIVAASAPKGVSSPIGIFPACGISACLTSMTAAGSRLRIIRRISSSPAARAGSPPPIRAERWNARRRASSGTITRFWCAETALLPISRWFLIPIMTLFIGLMSELIP